MIGSRIQGVGNSPKRLLLVLAVVVGLLAGTAIVAQALNAADEVAADVEQPDVQAQRIAAARASEEAEQQRVAVAQAFFANALREAPDKKESFTVSLAAPSAMETVIDSLLAADRQARIFTWLSAPSLVAPVVGVHQPANATTDTKVTRTPRELRDFYISYVEATLRSITESDGEVSEAQIAGLTSIREQLENDTPRIFGFRCYCTPTQILELEQDFGSSFRAVEVSDDPMLLPIYVENAVRDGILAEAGESK